MRTKGSPDELEHRRQLAVRRFLDGYSADEIAEFLGISPRTVWRWLGLFRARGPEGLTARPVPGRPPKLTVTRVVDRPPAGPADRGGVRHPVQPPLPQRVAEGPRLHPPEARTRPPRARPGGDRRLARFGLAAHQEEGEASGGSPRLDRRERPADGPAGPPHLGAPGPDAIPPPAWRPPQEGLRRG